MAVSLKEAGVAGVSQANFVAMRPAVALHCKLLWFVCALVPAPAVVACARAGVRGIVTTGLGSEDDIGRAEGGKAGRERGVVCCER